MKKSSVYLFYGEEDFLIEEKINSLKSRIENPSLNIEIIDGDNYSPECFAAALQTQPLLGGEKLVIVRNLKLSAENQEGLISLIKNIPPEVKVVFQAETIDKRSRFYRMASEQGEVLEFRSFAPWELDQLLDWIETYVRRRGKIITEGAARLLQEISGNNLRVLSGEIEKLLTYIGERDQINEEDVLALASPGETSAFSLLDALREKDLKKALSVFQVLLRNREDLFQLLSLLATQYRLMLQIKSLPGQEKDPWKIAKSVKGSPYFVKKCLEGIGRFTQEKLKKSLESLLEANLKLKTGESQTVVFELLLAWLCEN